MDRWRVKGSRYGKFDFQKSGFVTFLDLLKANLMQIIGKINDVKYENFCHGQTDGAGFMRLR